MFPSPRKEAVRSHDRRVVACSSLLAQELYEAVVGQVEAINNSVRLVRLDLPRHEMQVRP